MNRPATAMELTRWKQLGTDLVGEGDDVAGAGDVGPLGLLRRRREVVHRSEVEELGAAELLAIVQREREPGLGEVAASAHGGASPPGSRRSRCAAKRARDPGRTSTKTLSPRARSSGTRWRPMNPVAPVMKYVTRPTIAFYENRRQSHA